MSDKQDRRQDHPESQRALNRLLGMARYSLASYLMGAPPWTGPEGEPLLEVVRHIAAGQQADTVRIGRLLVRRHGYVDPGHYPTQLTESNDLALDYLAQRLIEQEQRMIDEIAQHVQQLVSDPEAKQLAEDALASEKQHLGLLTRLALPGRAPAQETLR